METHFILTHQPEAAPYKCAVCGRPFVNKSMFMSHKIMHINVNRYRKILIIHRPHWLKYFNISDILKNNLETVLGKASQVLWMWQGVWIREEFERTGGRRACHWSLQAVWRVRRNSKARQHGSTQAGSQRGHRMSSLWEVHKV